MVFNWGVGVERVPITCQALQCTNICRTGKKSVTSVYIATIVYRGSILN